MNDILDKLRSELLACSDEETRKSGERFFKEEVRLYGIKAAEVEIIAKDYFKTIAGYNKEAIFQLCEELWKSGYSEESFIASNWSYSVRKQYTLSDFEIFDRWVKNYVSNWASCDTLCNHTVGTLVEMYPECLTGLRRWAKSENRWVRRAAAVSLIIPARKGLFLNDIFEIAGILFSDSDDMVRKGYGWMLKAASQAHQDEVFDWIMARKDTMPRTSLRYAIEKMPKYLQQQAMEKKKKRL